MKKRKQLQISLDSHTLSEKVVKLYTHYQKAFDKVNCFILLAKLKNLKISHNWIYSIRT